MMFESKNIINRKTDGDHISTETTTTIIVLLTEHVDEHQHARIGHKQPYDRAARVAE